MNKKLQFFALIFSLLAMSINAQTTVGFEELSVPESGYYNGSTDHSGTISSTEVFTFSDSGANFSVNYTQEDGYGYWSGFAYSNQTDLETADYTNYSAYSTEGGGAVGSDNYIIAYLYGASSMSFDAPVSMTSVQIANSVWTYKFMTGEDGSGNDYEADDYFKLSVKGIHEDGTFTEPIEFYLADFTEGNNSIIADWTTVDLTPLGIVTGLEFQLEALESWTPYYFCMDNLVFNNNVSVDDTVITSFSMAPNPASNSVTITSVENATITLTDVLGKQVFTKSNCAPQELLSVAEYKSGVYIISVENNSTISTKKLLIE